MPRIATVRLKTASEQKCRANGPQKKSGVWEKIAQKSQYPNADYAK
jgi:hypothetical protein